jgi:hypothetical protein
MIIIVKENESNRFLNKIRSIDINKLFAFGIFFIAF